MAKSSRSHKKTKASSRRAKSLSRSSKKVSSRKTRSAPSVLRRHFSSNERMGRKRYYNDLKADIYQIRTDLEDLIEQEHETKNARKRKALKKEIELFHREYLKKERELKDLLDQ